MVPADSDRVPRAPPYSGFLWSFLIFAYWTCTFYGRPFNAVLLISIVFFSRSYYPSSFAGLASSAFARRYLRNHFCFLFLRVLRCFNSPGCSLMAYVFSHGWHTITYVGFPHSDIHGSLRSYRSPWRFAVWCVLLQLLVARHSPYALINLITLSYRRFFIRFSPYVFAPIFLDCFLSYCLFNCFLDFHLQLFRKIMFFSYLLLSGFQRSTWKNLHSSKTEQESCSFFVLSP